MNLEGETDAVERWWWLWSRREDEVEEWRRRSVVVAAASIVAQPALAEFLASGDFAAHVRRTRRIYARRLAALLDAGRHWSDHVAIEPTEAGLHVVARFGPRMAREVSDRAVAIAAREAGIVVAPLSASYARAPRGRGLLLGFAGFPEETLVAAMNRLGEVVRRLSGRLPRGPA